MSSNQDNWRRDQESWQNDASWWSPHPRVLSTPQNRRLRRSRTRPTNAMTFQGATVTVFIGTCCFLFPHATALFPSSLHSAPRSSIQYRAQATAVDACTKHSPTQLRSLSSKGDFDPDIAAQIEKAKRLLEDARKKQEGALETAADATTGAEGGEGGGGGGGGTATVPFFASRSQPDKIKSHLATGEVVADGETMASLSASEPWERRSLSQMFRDEPRVDFDGNVVEEERANTLAERDEAASIYNLRKKLMTEDFKKVFDPKNMFIGEVD